MANDECHGWNWALNGVILNEVMSLMYCELELLICLQFPMAVTRRACQFVVANGPFNHFSTLMWPHGTRVLKKSPWTYIIKKQNKKPERIHKAYWACSDVLVECEWVAGNICEYFLQQVFSKYRYKTHVISTSQSRSPRYEGVIFNDCPQRIYGPRWFNNILCPSQTLPGRLVSIGIAVVIQSMYYDVVLTFAQSDCSLHELPESLCSILSNWHTACSCWECGLWCSCSAIVMSPCGTRLVN